MKHTLSSAAKPLETAPNNQFPSQRCKRKYYLIPGTIRPSFLTLLWMLSWMAVFPKSNAQTVSPPFEVNCNQLIVEIVPLPYTGSSLPLSCSTCCAGSISCERVEYEVWLRAVSVPGNPLPPGGNFILNYSQLYITLQLDRTNAVVSAINETLTESCLASYLSSVADDYQANTIEDEITLHLSSQIGETLPGIPFVNGRSNGRLFSVIVDAFPGEEFGIGCTEFTYSSAQTGCENQICPGSPPAIFQKPASENSGLTLSLGDIDCGSQEDYIDLPVLVTSSLAGTINLFDFAVVVTGNAPDGFYADPEAVNILSGTSPSIQVIDKPGGGGYVVNMKYMTQSSAPFAGIEVPICTIRIYRPPNLCQGYSISTTLTAGRIRMNGITPGTFGCRAIHTDKTEAECVVPEVTICGDFKFNVVSETVDPANCDELIAYAKFEWDPADFDNMTSLDFEVFKMRLDFELGNGVSIVDVIPFGFACPGSGNDPINCPGNCIQYDNHSVNVCVNTLSANAVSVAHNAYFKIVFNAPTGCVAKAQVRKMVVKVKDEPSVCQPDINPPVGFKLCPPLMQGDIANELNCWVENVSVHIEPTGFSDPACTATLLTGSVNGDGCGPFGVCLCSSYQMYTITPSRKDNLLNGVTTYDLVLMSKHILGIEALGSPYKMIAADANKSDDITTFDIVEIRKLILGIYNDGDADPNNDWPSGNASSWRFILKKFPLKPDNPWKDDQGNDVILPESGDFSTPQTEADFVAIKTGDVNNSAIINCTDDNDQCHAFERPAGNIALYEPRRKMLKAGTYYTVPVKAGGNSPLIAWQTALRFDPALLELVGPSSGDLPDLSAENFNLTTSGEGMVRALWFARPDDEEAALQPEQALFYLTFKVRQDIDAVTRLLQTDEGSMPNLAWTAEGSSYRLSMSPPEAVEIREENLPPSEEPFLVRCRPNPSAGEITFDIAAFPPAQRARLSVLDAFGRRIWWRDLSKETGPLQIVVPEAAAWPAGVYHWELRRDKLRDRGTFIRQ